MRRLLNEEFEQVVVGHLVEFERLYMVHVVLELRRAPLAQLSIGVRSFHLANSVVYKAIVTHPHVLPR